MNRWMGIWASALMCVLAVGCNKTASDQDAIRASIDKRLSGRSDLNLGAMDRDVKQISVNGDHANAQVEFRVKGGDARMVIEYDLERQGKDWVVQNSKPLGMPDEPSGPGVMPPVSPDSGGQQFPQGHPPVN